MKVGYQLRDRKRATWGKPNQTKKKNWKTTSRTNPSFVSPPFYQILLFTTFCYFFFFNSGRFTH